MTVQNGFIDNDVGRHRIDARRVGS